MLLFKSLIKVSFKFKIKKFLVEALVLQYLTRVFVAALIADLNRIMKCLNSCSSVKAVLNHSGAK